MSMRAKKWIEQGGKLVGKPDFDQALDIRYKIQTDKKIKIKSKQEMLEDGIESPDEWDAFALTIAKRAAANTGRQHTEETKAKMAAYQSARTPEHREKLSQSFRGKTFSPETREKMRAAKLGKEPWNKGRKKGQ